MWFAHIGFQLAQPDDPTQLLVGGFSGTQVGAITGGLALAFVVGTAAWSLTFGRISNLRIMRISVGGLVATCIGLYLLNHSAPDATVVIVATAALVVGSLLVVSGFTPAALAHLAEISEGFHMNRGGVMGLYSVLLGLGQLIGGWTGGLFAQAWGVDGLIYATVIMGAIAYGSLQWLARVAPRTAVGTGAPAHRR
jgi:MFS family permease